MSPNMPDGLEEISDFDIPDVSVQQRLDNIDNRLDAIEKDIAEFKELAGKIWGFVEQMKTNPMFAAMLGGLPR